MKNQKPEVALGLFHTASFSYSAKMPDCRFVRQSTGVNSILENENKTRPHTIKILSPIHYSLSITAREDEFVIKAEPSIMSPRIRITIDPGTPNECVHETTVSAVAFHIIRDNEVPGRLSLSPDYCYVTAFDKSEDKSNEEKSLSDYEYTLTVVLRRKGSSNE